MKRNGRIELLAPAGNMDCVKAAVSNGADAVYLGGHLFNARAYADNFDRDALEQVCDLCHSYLVKVYVTVNTLYKDEEFPALLDFINELYVMGVDGLIMQDLGAIREVRKIWPDLPVHASTQLTVNSLADALELEALGVQTVVLSRELNLDEIREISSQTHVRVETFIHGALCVSYSGQCLMSSVLGSRSGNRGKCAQNCRLNYDLISNGRTLASGHLLSTKDICTLNDLPALLDSGVSSLKIEGRMKTPEYVAGVTRVYRKYLDLYLNGAEYSVDPDDVRTLLQLFNRGLFSGGYLKTHLGMEMMCPTHPKSWGVPAGKVKSYDGRTRLAEIHFEREMVPGDGIEIRTTRDDGTGCYINQPCPAGSDLSVRVSEPVRKNQEVWQTYDKRLMDTLGKSFDPIPRKVPVRAVLRLKEGQNAELTFSRDGFEGKSLGDIPQPAKTQPLSREAAAAQITKLGNTVFEAEQVTVEIDPDIFLNKASLNSLKNQAAEALRSELINASKRTGVSIPAARVVLPRSHAEKTLTVCVRTPGQFRAALDCPSVSFLYCDMTPELMAELPVCCDLAHRAGKRIGVRLPRIFRSYIQENMKEDLARCVKSLIDRFLISNLAHYHFVRETGKAFSLDYTGNILNARTFAFWKELGAETAAVSVEMSREEINALLDQMRTELLAYGRLPLMVTHQCPIGNYVGGKQNRMHCGKYGHTESYSLRNEKGNFLLETDCQNCLCAITTDTPQNLLSDIHLFDAALIRLDFSNEDAKTAARILSQYMGILEKSSSGQPSSGSIYEKSVR